MMIMQAALKPVESKASRSLWNPKFRMQGDDTLTIPADKPFVGTYLTQEDRDADYAKLNQLIDETHTRIGNQKAKVSIADMDSDSDTQE
jgi:hypothetical protein